MLGGPASCERDRRVTACSRVLYTVAEPEAFQHQRLDDTETGNQLQVRQLLISIMITGEEQVVRMSVCLTSWETQT